jgi:hypothetical protein
MAARLDFEIDSELETGAKTRIRPRAITRARCGFRPGQVRASQTVVAVWTETGGRLARVLASRCNVDMRSHRLASSAMR